MSRSCLLAQIASLCLRELSLQFPMKFPLFVNDDQRQAACQIIIIIWFPKNRGRKGLRNHCNYNVNHQPTAYTI